MPSYLFVNLLDAVCRNTSNYGFVCQILFAGICQSKATSHGQHQCNSLSMVGINGYTGIHVNTIYMKNLNKALMCDISSKHYFYQIYIAYEVVSSIDQLAS